MFIWTQFIDQLPVGLLAQLVERCTGIAEVMGSNPVRAWNFFQVLFTTTRFKSVLSYKDLLISRSVIFKKEFLGNKSDVSEIAFLIWSTMTKVCANSSLRIFIQAKQLFKLTLHFRCNHASDKAGHRPFHSMTHGRRKSRVTPRCSVGK